MGLIDSLTSFLTALPRTATTHNIKGIKLMNLAFATVGGCDCLSCTLKFEDFDIATATPQELCDTFKHHNSEIVMLSTSSEVESTKAIIWTVFYRLDLHKDWTLLKHEEETWDTVLRAFPGLPANVLLWLMHGCFDS